jgi:hypothetical protein
MKNAEMDKDWTRAAFATVHAAALERNFSVYTDDDLRGMIKCCQNQTISTTWPRDRDEAKECMRVLDEELNRRRTEAVQQRQQVAEGERHQQRTALDKEQVEQLTGIKKEVSGLSGHVAGITDDVKSLKDHAGEINARMAANEHYVRGIHREARRATVIGGVAVLVAIAIPIAIAIWDHRTKREQKPAVAPHAEVTNSMPASAPAFTNPAPKLSAVSNTPPSVVSIANTLTNVPATTNGTPAVTNAPPK